MSQDSLLKNRKILADNVKSLREKKHLKREELSLLLGFDNSYISKIEKCRVNITIDKISKIAEYFEIEVKNLFLIQKSAPLRKNAGGTANLWCR